jgi:hypothetical protein
MDEVLGFFVGVLVLMLDWHSHRPRIGREPTDRHCPSLAAGGSGCGWDGGRGSDVGWWAAYDHVRSVPGDSKLLADRDCERAVSAELAAEVK